MKQVQECKKRHSLESNMEMIVTINDASSRKRRRVVIADAMASGTLDLDEICEELR